MIRDVLAKEVPRIFLKGELYASTAAAGSLTVFILHRFITSDLAVSAGVIVTLALRLLSRQYNITLPARDPEKPLFPRDSTD